MKSDTTKQPLEDSKKYQLDIVPFNSLKVGEQFKFTYEGDIVRTVSQIGRTEIYCPIDGSNTMGHSKGGGEEVYAKSDKPVIKLTPITDSKEGLHTQNDEWFISGGMVDGYEIRTKSGKIIVSPHTTYPASHENLETIVKAVNNFDRMKEALEWLTEGVDEGETIKGAKVMHAIAEATTILSELNR